MSYLVLILIIYIYSNEKINKNQIKNEETITIKIIQS